MDAFEKESVLADMKIVLPGSQLKVIYSDGEITPNQTKTPSQVKDEPTLEWDADANALYMVVMNDPDAPSRAEPKVREWHHWCVTNIPGCDVSKGDVLSEYVGAGPPKDTGLHRYVFLVFKQVGKINFNEKKLTNRSMENRASQSAAAFAKKYKFGNPIAGNFFQAEYDDYCPQLYKQLSGE